MDLTRLKELEKLAGLELDDQQREQLLGDLILLEEFASSLPEISSDSSVPDASGKSNLKPSAALNMDRTLEQANAPHFSGGFYQVPTTRGKPSGEKA